MWIAKLNHLVNTLDEDGVLLTEYCQQLQKRGQFAFDEAPHLRGEECLLVIMRKHPGQLPGAEGLVLDLAGRMEESEKLNQVVELGLESQTLAHMLPNLIHQQVIMDSPSDQAVNNLKLGQQWASCPILLNLANGSREVTANKHQLMNKSRLDELSTQSTLLSSRKVFFRKPRSPDSSRGSSKRSSKNKALKPQLSTPYIRLNLLQSQHYSTTLKIPTSQAGHAKITEKTGELRPPATQKKSLNGSAAKDVSREKDLLARVEELLEETIMRQQELNQMVVEKEKLIIKMEDMDTHCKIVEQSNVVLLKNEETLKETVKKLTKEKSKLQSETAILVKKVSDLQGKAFPQKPNSLQSLREQYLDRQLSELKSRLSKEKSDGQKELEKEVSDIREKLFNANRLIQTMRINNLCLQQKNQNLSKEIRMTPQLIGLRSKYKKTLVEKSQLQKLREVTIKQMDSLANENKILKKELFQLKQIVICEESLNFSVLSNMSEFLV